MDVADENQNSYLNGRGAQINTANKFLKNSLAKEHAEGIDDWDCLLYTSRCV